MTENRCNSTIFEEIYSILFYSETSYEFYAAIFVIAFREGFLHTLFVTHEGFIPGSPHSCLLTDNFSEEPFL